MLNKQEKKIIESLQDSLKKIKDDLQKTFIFDFQKNFINSIEETINCICYNCGRSINETYEYNDVYDIDSKVGDKIKPVISEINRIHSVIDSIIDNKFNNKKSIIDKWNNREKREQKDKLIKEKLILKGIKKGKLEVLEKFESNKHKLVLKGFKEYRDLNKLTKKDILLKGLILKEQIELGMNPELKEVIDKFYKKKE